MAIQYPTPRYILEQRAIRKGKGQMKETTSKGGSVIAIRRKGLRPLRGRGAIRCAICTSRIWFAPVDIIEPESVPEPRLCWLLCNACYKALLAEVRRSPVRSPLRLRIAMGIVASERWPQAYPTRVRTFLNDRKWIVFIAVGFIVAMILHLMLIVMIAAIK
jgi:hypothetical protein